MRFALILLLVLTYFSPQKEKEVLCYKHQTEERFDVVISSFSSIDDQQALEGDRRVPVSGMRNRTNTSSLPRHDSFGGGAYSMLLMAQLEIQNALYSLCIGQKSPQMAAREASMLGNKLYLSNRELLI